MLKRLLDLDRKLGKTIEQLDQAAQPMTRVMTFEVFQKADAEQEKATQLVAIRRNAAGMEYEVPGAKIQETPATEEVCPPNTRCRLEQSTI